MKRSIIKFISVIAIIILLVVTLTGCTVTKTSSKTTSKNIGQTNNLNDDKLKENIKIEALGITKNGDFAFKVKNDNDKTIYISTVNIIFKDNDGNFVEKAESQIQFFIIEAHSEVVNFAWGFEKDYEKYKNYEFEFEFVSDYMKTSLATRNFEIVANDTSKQIAVSVKNNNILGMKSLLLLVAYYNDGKIVGCQVGYNDTILEANKTAYINVRYPEDSRGQKVDYDEYKTYLLQAWIK